MSRIDKYEPYGGGFRAPLNAAITTTDVGKVQAVALNASGRVVIGTAALGIVGVICPVKPMAAGDQIDVMTNGEIVEFTLTGGGAAAAGTVYYADGAGATTATVPGAGINGARLGQTVEATRLVVRVQHVQG